MYCDMCSQNAQQLAISESINVLSELYVSEQRVCDSCNSYIEQIRPNAELYRKGIKKVADKTWCVQVHLWVDRQYD